MKYGNRNVPKMIGQVETLRQIIRAEGTPAVQDAWDKVEEHIDYAYRADLAQAPAPVRVKGLRWHNFDAWTHWAEGACGTYHVEERNGYWQVELRVGSLVHGVTETDGTTPPDLAAAKAAAQADYETRILAALEAPDAGVVAELVEAAEHVLRDIDDLVANSEGVAGLHMNGDIADWQSLLDGGSFGSWLSSLERLRAALAIIAHNTTETRA